MNLSEHITLYIHQATDDGKPLVDFLLDIMQARIPDVTTGLRFKAAEHLAIYGGFVPDQLPTLDNLPARNDANANAKSGKPAKKAKKHKVTEKELLNYDIIRMIKQDTRNGELLVDLLIHVAIEGKMSNSRRFISPSTRMRAAQELLTRGFGAVSPRRISTGKNEGLGATISKRIRKDTDNGREAAAYLMDIVAGNPPHHAKPSKRKRFTPHRRVLAACELLRRLCDIRTDHITPEHIQAYWTSQTPIDARARETHANSRPDINRTGIDKATALAAMATPASSDERNTAAAPAANTASAQPKDPFPPRGKARMGASPDNTPADVSKQSNTAKHAADAGETQTNATASAQPKDPFPPRGKARMGTSPATDAAETHTADAVSDERDNATNTAKTAISEPPASANKSVDNTADASNPSNTIKTAVSEPPDNANIAVSDERDNATNTAKTAISEPPASANKSVDNTADASNPSNTTKTAVSPERDTTPSHPNAPASNPSRKPTRRQRQKANKRKQRRAQRKARSP